MNVIKSLLCGICNSCCEVTKSFELYTQTKCYNCGVVGFICKQSYSYNNENKKYGDQQYLENYELRWAHKQVLKLLSENESTHEIGCFNGQYVKLLNDCGINATGSDINNSSIKYGQKAFSLNDRLFDFIPQRLNNTTVILIDVLEHIENPLSFLESLRLKGVKKMIISLPDSDRILKDKSDFPPHHLWRFNLKSLKMLGEQLDLEVSFYKREYNGMLFFRNLVGRLLFGWNKRYFIGAPVFRIKSGLAESIYSFLSFFLSPIFKLVRLNHASIIVVIE